MDTSSEEPTTLESLPDVLLLHVLLHPDLETHVSCAALSTRFRPLAADDSYWRDLCSKRWGVTSPHPPRRRSTVSGGDALPYVQVARAWWDLERELEWDLLAPADADDSIVRRGRREVHEYLVYEQDEDIDIYNLTHLASLWEMASVTWFSLERWFDTHVPLIAQSFLPPANAAAWRTFEQAINLAPLDSRHREMLLPLRLLSAIHDGQCNASDYILATHQNFCTMEDLPPPPAAVLEDIQNSCHIGSRYLGMFGGYSAYDVEVKRERERENGLLCLVLFMSPPLFCVWFCSFAPFFWCILLFISPYLKVCVLTVVHPFPAHSHHSNHICVHPSIGSCKGEHASLPSRALGRVDAATTQDAIDQRQTSRRRG